MVTSNTAKRVVWTGTRGGDDVSTDQGDIAIDDVQYSAICEGSRWNFSETRVHFVDPLFLFYILYVVFCSYILHKLQL